MIGNAITRPAHRRSSSKNPAFQVSATPDDGEPTIITDHPLLYGTAHKHAELSWDFRSSA
jgi:hypothetical protein